jgi:moderate conductance mechanosensitive channel
MFSPIAVAALTPAEVDACGDDAGATCLFAFRVTDNELVAKVVDWVVDVPVKLLLILVVAVVVNRLVQRAIRRFISGLQAPVLRGLDRPPGDDLNPVSMMVTAPANPRLLQRAQTLGLVLRSLAKMVIVVIALLMALGELGLNLGPLIAGAGIVGVALGFGAQSLVKDFLSGMFMLVEDQFGVGDVINAGEAEGTVEGVSLRTTRLRDDDGTIWHIPNGEIKRVANKSQT